MKSKYFNLLLLLLVLVFSEKSISQTNNVKEFTIDEAVNFAVANSYKVRMADLDFQSTVAQRKGFISIGLPQVNASASYQYFIEIPTQLMPNFLTPAIEGTLLQYGLISPMQIKPSEGEKFPVQFGSPNNMSVGASVSQLVFDGTFVVGLKAARMLVDMSKISKDRSIVETKATVTQAYIMVLIARENLKILDSTYNKMNDIFLQTKEMQKNGFMDETDIEQLSLNLSNLKSKLDFSRRNIALVTDLLKFQMGIPIEDEIFLKDDIQELINKAVNSSITEKQFDINANIDFQLLKKSEMLARQTLKVDQAKYYPSINLVFSTQSTAQREKFDFFNNGKWYNTSLIGVNLSVPIWSSGIRHYKIKQDKLNITKQQIMVKQAEEGLKIEVENSRIALKMLMQQYFTDKKNLELSGKIYNKTHIKFKEGLSSAMDLNQAYLQLLTQEGNYINTMLQLLNTYTNLNKTLNTL